MDYNDWNTSNSHPITEGTLTPMMEELKKISDKMVKCMWVYSNTEIEWFKKKICDLNKINEPAYSILGTNVYVDATIPPGFIKVESNNGEIQWIDISENKQK
jgi:hypothetical protein